MQILIISDIHGNYPALEAVDSAFREKDFDLVINCGDSLVYGPFPNETLQWLQDNSAISILGNTDKKVLTLLSGKKLDKPTNPDKLVMYTWTAEQLSTGNAAYLKSLKKKSHTLVEDSGKNANRNIWDIGIFHGSPAKNHEFLFDTTPDSRFIELSRMTSSDIVLCGHSHTPFHKVIGPTHFINPGSIGRMFDGDPRASCATIEISANTISVDLLRISYDIEKTVEALQHHSLPEMYCEMYRKGLKTN